MKTLNEELQALENDTRGKREAIVAKHVILNSGILDIAKGYHPPFVHHSKLWGAAGWISFDGCDYDSIREGKNPDRALFRSLLDKYPYAVPIVRVKDGCTSFRPDIEENNVKGDLYDCGPIIARINIFQRSTAEFSWYTRINDALWGIHIKFPLHMVELGQLNARPKYVGDTITSWERCDFYANAPAQIVKWASGGKEYPNSFTLYWDRDNGYAIDFPSLVNE